MGRVVRYLCLLSEGRGGRADENGERCEEHWEALGVGGIDGGIGMARFVDVGRKEKKERRG